MERMSRSMVLLGFLLIDVLAIIIALLVGNHPMEQFSEYGFITRVSFVQLLIISGIAYLIFFMSMMRTGVRDWKSPAIPWVIIATAFLYFGLDEYYQIHENIGVLILRIFQIQENAVTVRIDDFIIGGYGVLVLILIFRYRVELSAYRGAYPLLRIACVLGFVTVGLDIFTHRADLLQMIVQTPYVSKSLWMVFNIMEESLELVTEAVLLAIAFWCLDITRNLPAAND